MSYRRLAANKTARLHKLHFPEEPSVPHTKKGTFRKVRAKCSCWMCGNPRRYQKSKERLTCQERRFKESSSMR